MDTPLRVLIADDHPLFRQGLRGVLAVAEGIAVVGEAATGEEAIDLAAQVQPDVILMDLTMPGMNGIEASAAHLGQPSQIGIVVLTMYRRRRVGLRRDAGGGAGLPAQRGRSSRGAPRHPGGQQR